VEVSRARRRAQHCEKAVMAKGVGYRVQDVEQGWEEMSTIARRRR
jgi:hypothetical protein